MSDVAARAGVSRALVSLVFRDRPGASIATRTRVFQAAEELGYHPDAAAQLLASSRSKVLGLMLTVQNPFHADLVEAMYLAAEGLGYDILLSATGPKRAEKKAITALLAHRCEALVLLGPTTPAEELDDLSRRLPVVAVGRRLPGLPLDTVRADDTKGITQALDHLIGLGHRDIVHIDGGTGSGASERRRAYQEVMSTRGLGRFSRVLPGDHTEASGKRAAGALRRDSRLPTAVLAANDRCAMGLLQEIRRGGMEVPAELSVIGYDDSHIAHLSGIDLTTVRQDVDATAQLAVRNAVERIAEPGLAPRELVLDPKLMVRGTTGTPPPQSPGLVRS
jgi:DNA-binding LacI/PurR family transcriptional regulator